MKPNTRKLLLGLGLAATGYAAVYLLCTAPHQMWLRGAKPELAWLKHEFNLSDSEFARISRLHDAYKPQCAVMCLRIDALNASLTNLLAPANTITPEIEAKLREAAEVRVECQKAMLKHFYEVSQSMPPEQGKRYLAWMHTRTSLPAHKMAQALDDKSGSRAILPTMKGME